MSMMLISNEIFQINETSTTLDDYSHYDFDVITVATGFVSLLALISFPILSVNLFPPAQPRPQIHLT